MPTLTRAQVRDLDHRAMEEFGVPGVVLMENAGRNAAEVLHLLGVTGPVHIVCGKGNNGGDGYVLARHLDLRCIPLAIHLCCKESELTGDALTHYRVVKHSGIPIFHYTTDSTLAAHLLDAEWIVDALFGTGLVGVVRPPFDTIIDRINHSGKPVLALDLPSGLDADTGQAPGPTIRANHTVTFVAPKRGFAAPEALPYLGTVHVAEIGAPRQLLEQYGITPYSPHTS